jgi:3-oxoacyl-[acyl-carrier-protein] synthase II
MSEGIVITGAGLVTPLGLTREQTWQSVLAMKCGIGPLTALEQAEPVVKGGGQAPELPGDFWPDQPREVRYLRRALEEALREAGALRSLPYSSHRCGFMLGTTLHGMRAAGNFLRTGDHGKLKDFLAGSTLRAAAEGLELSGPAVTTCSACSSSLGSIALAVTLLESRQLDLVVAGGYDTISEYAYAGFNSLRLVADGALRPFARDRQGMKLAEGYGIVVLERRSDAGARKAPTIATIQGWGESADAHHLTQPHPEGEGAARAIAAALTDAGLTSGDIDLIAAHATGTPDNDAGEYAALRRVFGDGLARVPVVGFKSHLGHTLGGAGACELILSAMALRDQIVPGCANAQAGQSDFEDLNLSTQSKPGQVRATLNTSLGFGGANTCVILTPAVAKPESSIRFHRTTESMCEVFITGMGVLAPGIFSLAKFADRLAEESGSERAGRSGVIDESAYLHLLNARRVRRMSDYVKLSLAATTMAIADGKIDDVSAFAESCSVIVGSMHGSTNYSLSYYRQIVDEGILSANPMLFAEGVPNAAAAHLSLMLSLKGACQTVIGSRTSGLDALRLASLRIATGQWERAIVGAAEEDHALVNASYAHCGLYSVSGSSSPFSDALGFSTGAAAVTFVLESRKSMEERSARPWARVLGGSSCRATGGSPVGAAEHVLAEMGHPRQLIGSANGTWIDRAELAAIRQTDRPTLVSSVYGHVAESFSATPLLGIAAALVSGKLPRLLGPLAASGVEPACCEKLDSAFGVLCTDYSGVVSGATLSPTER